MNKEIKALFEEFCEAYNLQTSAKTRRENPEQKEFYSNDFIKMDHNSEYGGYVLMIVHTTTSQSAFDSHSRKSKAEMCAYLQGLLAAKNSFKFEGIIKTV